MPAPVVFALGIALALGAQGGTEGRQLVARHTFSGAAGVAFPIPPDTTRRTAPPDTMRRVALVPDTTAVPADEAKPTRKTTLLTLLAIGVLTVSTLLLYNVRSR
jgi:hypothetical protein